MHIRFTHQWCSVLVVALAAGALAKEAAAVLVITEPWVLFSPNSRNTEAYVQLRSNEGATLIGARSDAVERIDIHSTASPRAAVGAIELPPGKTVLLAPGADRLVLRGLDRPRKLGDYVSLTLSFIEADKAMRDIEIQAEVRLHSPTYDHKHGHPH